MKPDQLPTDRFCPQLRGALLAVAALTALLFASAGRFARYALPAASAAPVRSGQTVAAPKAYIGLFGDNAVAVFDTASQQVVRTIAVPAGPHGLVITPDGSTVYVSSDGASTVSVIDTATDAIVQSIEVGQTPHGLALTPDGRDVLVAVFGASQLVEIDTSSNEVVNRVTVPNPHNIAITPDGTTAYVASQQPNAAALAVIDLASFTQTTAIPLPKTPRALNFSPDGRQLYFTEAGSDAVQVLDPTTNTIVTQIAVGASPHQPLFTPDGAYALVVDQGPGTISFIATTGGAVAATVKVGEMPHWIAISADGATAYVTNENSGDLSVIDIVRQTVTATIAVGAAPRKIVVQPSPSASSAASATTTIAGFAFTPQNLSVSAGSTVSWTNADSVTHTSTSDDGGWASGPLQPGQSFSVRLDQPGGFTYHCAIHPFMQGTITVSP